MFPPEGTVEQRDDQNYLFSTLQQYQLRVAFLWEKLWNEFCENRPLGFNARDFDSKIGCSEGSRICEDRSELSDQE